MFTPIRSPLPPDHNSPLPALTPSLSTRLASYESASPSPPLTPGKPTILRLTLHHHRPFAPHDLNFAMIVTTTDLLDHFPTATTAYTFEGEIALVFPCGVGGVGTGGAGKKGYHGNGGVGERKMQEVASLAAGFASVRFGISLREDVEEEDERKRTKFGAGTPHFSGFLFGLASIEEATEYFYLLWRWCRGDEKGDAVRTDDKTDRGGNAIASPTTALGPKPTLFRKSFSHRLKDMLGMNKDVIAIGNADEDVVPGGTQEGSLIKREKYICIRTHAKTQEKEVTERVRIRVEARGIRGTESAEVRQVGERYWCG